MWRTVKLGDLLEVQNGYAFNSKQFDADGDMPLIRIRDLKNAIATETRYTGEYDEKYVVKKGDLLIGMDGEFRCYEWRGESALLNQRVCRLQNFHTDLNQRFLLYSINDVLKKIEDVTGFTTVKHLSSKTITQIELPLPPLAEQQRIVAKLDAAFAEIDRAIESYEDSVSNAKNCLSKVRASRVTEVLSNSQTAKLGSFASLKNGLNYDKSEKGYSVKILGVGDFGNRFRIGTEDLQVIETKIPVSTDYHLEHGDIVFVRSNGNRQLIGRSILIENPSEPATFSGFCIRCRIETADLSPLFLCHYLKSSVVRDKLISEGGGANISNLNQKILADIDVPLLSQHEQMSLVRWIEKLEKSFEDFVATLVKRVQLADNLKAAILAQELQPPQSEAA